MDCRFANHCLCEIEKARDARLECHVPPSAYDESTAWPLFEMYWDSRVHEINNCTKNIRCVLGKQRGEDVTSDDSA